MSIYTVAADGTVKMASDNKLRDYKALKNDQDLTFADCEDRQRRFQQRAAYADALRMYDEEKKKKRAQRQFLVTLAQQLLDLGRLAGMSREVAETWASRLMVARWNPFERERLMMESTALAVCLPSGT